MQLNPFEIKAEIVKIFSELKGVKDFESYEIHYRALDLQENKNIISKLLFKEINNQDNQELLKFLLIRYSDTDKLTEQLWNILKNNMSSNQAKIFALDLLRDIDTNWSYDTCEQYLDNPDELVDSDTKRILDNAILNPEVQIDFLDFLKSLSDEDKITLLNSLGNDYTKDELANMLIPVFLSTPYTAVGKTALELLGNSKSQLAYYALTSVLDAADESLIPAIKKNLSLLKLSGIREDNAVEFYKNILKDSKPYKFCITYPDGQGNQAVIISRINKQGKIQFVATVINDYDGIVDCFGFNEISKFECNAIIERFYRGQRAINLEPSVLKSILVGAEKFSKMPYEYICWKNMLIDIECVPLKLNYELRKLSNSEFEDILKYDFTDFWFLNSTYSDEFEEFLKLLDNPKDYEKLIDENLEKVFYPEEYRIWSDRILNVALLKHLAGKEKEAQQLYFLYNDKELKRELFKNILRKSIYEYYYSKNDKEKIQAIEDMWVEPEGKKARSSEGRL